MLVTLQKESGLLSRTDVSASSYNAAWGWHCPDSGPGRHRPTAIRRTRASSTRATGWPSSGRATSSTRSKYNYHAGQTVEHPVERRRIGLRIGARDDPEHRHRLAVHLHAVPAERGRAGRLSRASATAAPPTATATSSTCSASTSARPAAARRRPRSSAVLSTGTTGHHPEQPVRLRGAGRPDDHRAERGGGRRSGRRVLGARSALRVGWRRLRCRTEQRLRARRRRLQQLRQRPSGSTARG